MFDPSSTLVISLTLIRSGTGLNAVYRLNGKRTPSASVRSFLHANSALLTFPASYIRQNTVSELFGTGGTGSSAVSDTVSTVRVLQAVTGGSDDSAEKGIREKLDRTLVAQRSTKVSIDAMEARIEAQRRTRQLRQTIDRLETAIQAERERLTAGAVLEIGAALFRREGQICAIQHALTVAEGERERAQETVEGLAARVESMTAPLLPSLLVVLQKSLKVMLKEAEAESVRVQRQHLSNAQDTETLSVGEQ
ncbi:hypothetical protein KIPB_003356, partial [Kipferlia bialata]|eukprot:g3356.t1